MPINLKRADLPRNVILTATALLAAVLIISGLNPPPKTKVAVVLPDAINTLTRDNNPKLFKQWGQPGFDRINTLMPLAAAQVARAPDCDALYYIDLSAKSTPNGPITFFADCKNGKRFFVNEADIAAGTAAQSDAENAANTSDSVALATCHNAIKAQIKNPKSLKPSTTGVDIHRPASGNIIVLAKFKSRNEIGIEVPQTARCDLNSQGQIQSAPVISIN